MVEEEEQEEAREEEVAQDQMQVPVVPQRQHVRQVAGLHGEEQVQLEGLIDPEVPGPRPVAPADALGWNVIDTFGVWECTLCEFPMMKDIPSRFRDIWCATLANIFKRIQQSEGGVELERGLKWLLVIPLADDDSNSSRASTVATSATVQSEKDSRESKKTGICHSGWLPALFLKSLILNLASLCL